MANETAGDKKVKKTSSAEKQARAAKRRRLFNQMVDTRLTGAERTLHELVKKGDKAKITEQLRLVYSLADRAAKRNVISKNAASRKKSRLTAFALPWNGKKSK